MMENIGAEWRASVDALRNDITREERRGMEPFQNEPGSLTPDTVDNLWSDVNQLRPYVEAFREEFLKNLQTVKQDVNADWKCTVGELFERVESVAAVSATELRSTDAAWRASLKAIKDELVGLIDTTKEGLGCLVSGIETKWVSKFNSVSSVALVDEVVGHVKQGMDEMRLSLELQRKDVDGKIDSHRSLIEERLNCLKSELDEEWRSCVEACRDELLGRIDATDPTNELAQVRTAQAECQASVTAIRVESSALAVSVAATEIGLESLRNDVDSETRQADVRWKSGQETHDELSERLNAATEKLECLSKDVESDRPQVDKLREDFARNLQSMASVAFVEECAGLKSSSTEDRLRVFKQDLDFEWGTRLEDLRCEFTERNDAAVKPKQDVEAEREWRTGVEAFVRECVAHEVDAVLRTVVTKTSSTVQQELVRLRDDVEWRSAYNSCKDSLAALTKRVAENTERIGDCESSRALRETDATGGICEWQRVMDMLQNDVRQIESAVASETRQAELRWADVKEITDQFVGKLNSTAQQLECLRKDIEPGRPQMEKLREEIMRKLQSMASVAFVEECAGLKSSSTEQRLKLFKHDMDLEWRPRLEVLRCEFMGRIDAVAKQRQDIEAESREWRTSFEAFVHDHVAKEVDAVLSTVVTKTSSMVQQELGRFRADVSVEWRTAYESCKDSLEALTRRVAENTESTVARKSALGTGKSELSSRKAEACKEAHAVLSSKVDAARVATSTEQMLARLKQDMDRHAAEWRSDITACRREVASLARIRGKDVAGSVGLEGCQLEEGFRTEHVARSLERVNQECSEIRSMVKDCVEAQHALAVSNAALSDKIAACQSAQEVREGDVPTVKGLTDCSSADADARHLRHVLPSADTMVVLENNIRKLQGRFDILQVQVQDHMEQRGLKREEMRSDLRVELSREIEAHCQEICSIRIAPLADETKRQADMLREIALGVCEEREVRQLAENVLFNLVKGSNPGSDGVMQL